MSDEKLTGAAEPVPMVLHCPECKARHIDEGEFATKLHHTHSCQSCGLTWRPAVVATCGVRFLPGFKNAEGTADEERAVLDAMAELSDEWLRSEWCTWRKVADAELARRARRAVKHGR